MTAKKDSAILIAMTNFKGSLSNLEACQAVAEALTELKIPCQTLPIGDGGSGTSLAVHQVLGGEHEIFESTDPRGKRVQVQVLCLPNATSPTQLLIESSQVCGHSLVPEKERDVLCATSYGLGTLLVACHKRWPSTALEVYIALGDSAVSDAGIGMLSALGFGFLNSSLQILDPLAFNLEKIAHFKLPENPLPNFSLTVLCDVNNPLCGEAGSARVFAPQKGANPEQIAQLERGLENFSARLLSQTGKYVALLPMTGSAGGLASAFYACLNARLVPGCEFLFDWIDFDSILSRHSLVISGEGRTDHQTLFNKAPTIVAQRAQRLGKKMILISGSLGAGYEVLSKMDSLLGCYASGREPDPFTALQRKTIAVFSEIFPF